MYRLVIVAILSFLLYSCSSSKKVYNPDRFFPKKVLQEDYTLLRIVLEKKHPALYWYTPKDSMDMYFDDFYRQIKDSMTEQQFGWQIIAPLTQKIRCGHTGFGMSKKWNAYYKDKQVPCFPLHLKIWNDTMVVTVNLNKKDSILKRGCLITSINNIKAHDLIDYMLQFLPLDGYANNVNYVRLSSNFPYYHGNIIGIYDHYKVMYKDSTGADKKINLPMYTIPKDSTRKSGKIETAHLKKPSRRQLKKERLESLRSLKIDTTLHTAYMTLNTFSKKNNKGPGKLFEKGLNYFIRKSFREMHRQHISNLVLDIRGNGGGDVNMYVLLTRYLRDSRFKVADSAYSVTRSLGPYSRYFSHALKNNIGLRFITHKRKDGNYHFSYLEKHMYSPKKRFHFNGQVYVLTNGPTFSASTLFCNAVKGQKNVLLVGEETGGGWYGNCGIFLPDLTLPNTRLRLRLPLFKLVQYHHIANKGSGVIPDIHIGPSIEGIKRGTDRKMEWVKKQIASP